MTRPRWSIGANTADRVPTTTSTSPRRMRCHWSCRSPSDSAECWMATRSPKRVAQRGRDGGRQRDLGHQHQHAPAIGAHRRCASRRYTSVLPLPVTPCSSATPKARAAASVAQPRAGRGSCSSVRTTRAFAASRPSSCSAVAPSKGSRSTRRSRSAAQAAPDESRPRRRATRPAPRGPRARSPAGCARSAARQRLLLRGQRARAGSPPSRVGRSSAARTARS